MKEEKGTCLLPTNLQIYMNSYPESVVVVQQLELVMLFGMNFAKISNVIAHPEFIVKGNVSAFNSWQDLSFLKIEYYEAAHGEKKKKKILTLTYKNVPCLDLLAAAPFC